MTTKRPIRLAVVSAALFLLSVLAPGQAHAHSSTTSTATPGNDTSHPWASNGCGPSGAGLLVPDKIVGILNFNHACDHHDGCYGGFKVKGKVTRRVTRLTCDNEFRSNMLASCRWQHGSNLDRTWSSRRCRQLSGTYYSAVRKGGGKSYSGPKSMNN